MSYRKKQLRRVYFFYVIPQQAMTVKESRKEKGCKIALHEDRRHYIVEHRYRSHRRCRINDNRSGNDHSSSYGASNRYRSKCPARDGYCPRGNQPREQKSLAGRKKDGNERTLVLVHRIARSDNDKG